MMSAEEERMRDRRYYSLVDNCATVAALIFLVALALAWIF